MRIAGIRPARCKHRKADSNVYKLQSLGSVALVTSRALLRVLPRSIRTKQLLNIHRKIHLEAVKSNAVSSDKSQTFSEKISRFLSLLEANLKLMETKNIFSPPLREIS